MSKAWPRPAGASAASTGVARAVSEEQTQPAGVQPLADVLMHCGNAAYDE